MKSNNNELVQLSLEEMLYINGGEGDRKSPKECAEEILNKIGDAVAYGIGWLIAVEGARVAGSTLGGNAAAVVAYK